MAKSPFRMFTAERIALLLLAVALLVWASIVWLSRISAPQADTFPKPVVDTIVIKEADTTVINRPVYKEKPKSKKKAKASKSKKQETPVDRSHLDEVVSE